MSGAVAAEEAGMAHPNTKNGSAVLTTLLGEDLAATMTQYLEDEEVRKLSSVLAGDTAKSSADLERLRSLLDTYQLSQVFPPIS